MLGRACANRPTESQRTARKWEMSSPTSSHGMGKHRGAGVAWTREPGWVKTEVRAIVPSTDPRENPGNSGRSGVKSEREHTSINHECWNINTENLHHHETRYNQEEKILPVIIEKICTIHRKGVGNLDTFCFFDMWSPSSHLLQQGAV